jgi:uncharacterized membrane protein
VARRRPNRIVAFVFNAALLALSVDIAAGAI